MRAYSASSYQNREPDAIHVNNFYSPLRQDIGRSPTLERYIQHPSPPNNVNQIDNQLVAEQ